MDNRNEPLYSRIAFERFLINNSLRPMALFLYCAVCVILKNRQVALFHKRTDPVTLFAVLFDEITCSEVESHVAITSYQSVLAANKQWLYYTAHCVHVVSKQPVQYKSTKELIDYLNFFRIFFSRRD